MDSRHDSLGFLLSDVSRSMRRAFKQRIEGSSLTLAQSRALVHISRNEGIRQVDLAEILEVQPITLARLIDQLVRAGVVERRSDPADRRVFRLFLTTAAEPQLLAIHQVADAIRDQALRNLSPPEAQMIHDVLRKMRDNFATQP
ncbi:MAG: MarR family transcriptional regulator [Vicinamibacteria bacterium]|nr:MarR family transcriptional regulator [Vicinamibacteria bacterium]